MSDNTCKNCADCASCGELEKSVTELNGMIKAGKVLEAFDKFYADNVTMQENNDAPRVGKAENRKAEEAFVGGIQEFGTWTPLSVGIGDGVAFVEWTCTFKHKEWGQVTMNQVSVQHWKDGKIVSERFYYSKK